MIWDITHTFHVVLPEAQKLGVSQILRIVNSCGTQ
jgi:hypothetical protein